MRQTTWKLGWYSKVVLTVIAVSLVGLLVRQLPEKVEAKPERYKIDVSVVSLDADDLRTSLMVYLSYDKEREKKRELPFLGSEMRALAQEVFDGTPANRYRLLEQVLQYAYAMGNRVKFMTDDFIILESE